MMALLIISLEAFLTTILTFFSDFGLGAILMPLFVLFFAVDLAIALTSAVHFSNNLFKMALVGRKVDKEVLMKFGIPAILASFGGAFIGNNLLKKFTFRSIQLLVAVMLLMIATALGWDCFAPPSAFTPCRPATPSLKRAISTGRVITGFIFIKMIILTQNEGPSAYASSYNPLNF